MEWKTVKLGEVAEVKGGKRLPKGVSLITTPNSHPYIRIRDLGVSKTLELNSDYEYVDDVTQKSIAHYIVNTGDILLSIVGTIGLVAVVGASLNYANQTENCVKITKLNGIDRDYLYYFLKSDIGQSAIDQGTVGAVQAKLPLKTVLSIDISLPPLPSQRRIAAILSSLDAQIENNNRINRNLEEQAQALFKSWFVDFEPWGGKMPDGWREGKYIDIIEKTVSGDWGKESIEGNYTHEVACVRGCDFEDIKNGTRGKTPCRYILEKNYQSKHLNPQDVLVEISGGTATVSTGRVCLVSKELLDQYENNIVCTNFCKVVRPLIGYSAYLFYSWLYKYNCKVMFGYENGTSGIKNFAIADFIEKERVLLPTIEDIAKFQKIIDVLYAKIQENGKQSARLAALRDTLLPKLMKGEIEV